MARKPAARVHALLTLLRPVVDEIVLAADRTGDPNTLEACTELADRRLLAEPGPFNRQIGWLHHECSGDWILRLEDDEVPSRAFLDGIRDLLAERYLTHAAFTRRWLHPTPDRYLTSQPWLPDYQVRLVRNVPSLWRFPGVMHAPIEVLGDRRHVDLPIYHCDLVLASLAERRAKRDGYEERRPGLTSAGLPLNSMYTPEDAGPVECAQVPADDAELIERVARAPAPVVSARGGPQHVVTLAEHDRFSETRAVGERAYRARVELLDPIDVLTAGGTALHEILVENLGDEVWPGGDGRPPIRLGSRWTGPSGGPEGRALFPETVLPGMSTRVMLPVPAPRAPGRHTLELDLVHEHVRWFGAGVRMDVDVVGSMDRNGAGAGEAARWMPTPEGNARKPPATPTAIAGTEVMELRPTPDERGNFVEVFRLAWLGTERPVQLNLVTSGPRVVRGMHWHELHTDYLAVATGRLMVALVDLRVGSPTEWVTELMELDASRPQLLMVPPGVGHGFFTEEHSAVLYAVTRYWDHEDEFGFRYDDPQAAIPWPAAAAAPTVSERDLALPFLADARRRPVFSDRGGGRFRRRVKDLAKLLDGGADGEALGAGGTRGRASGAMRDEVP